MAGFASSADFTRRPEELAFLQAIVEAPGDDTLWLILADWLEEHDDPRRAELLRLHRRLLDTCCEPEQHPQRAGWQKRLVELLATGVRPCVPQRRLDLSGGVEMVFSWVPPGSFLMGSPPKEEERSKDEVQHRVTLTRGFWMGVTPVTQAQWQALMGSNPSHFQGPYRPVECVSWEDCQAFCQKLIGQDGESYVLPTEAQWEYACRTGTTTPFHFGPALSSDRANYRGNYPYGQGSWGLDRQETTPVGSFPPNAWGLVDLHGNVWEWCQGSYGPYPSSDVIDPEDSKRRDRRLARGGSWHSTPGMCRAAHRTWNLPGHLDRNVGFRVRLRLD
jgi:uncharacterized protein (TIGR02996 family)